MNIPNSVTSIGSGSFRGCSSLTSVNIPDSVTSIGWGAFESCISLADVVWPGQITGLGANILDGTAYYNNADNWEGNILYVGPY